ncbi:MAG: glycosyltransferase family 39 protein [Candidatus Delongbacteria bacterium]
MSRRRDWLWALLLLTALQAVSLHKSFWGAHGEARRAEVAREVLEDGHWLVPTLLGEPFLTKPPLLYWAGAGSMALFGVSEWAVRLPALLAALLAWLAMLSLARSYAEDLAEVGSPPDHTPEEAALALLGLPLFLAMSLNAETEPLLLACGLWAVAGVLRLPPRGQPRSWPGLLLPIVALSLGFLVKGPLGWIFPLLGLVAFESGLPVQRRRLGAADWLWLLLGQLPLVLPWFLLVLARHPDALQIWLGESVARVTDAGFQVHREPWWYYLPQLAVFLPALLWLDPRVWRERTRRIPLLWLGAGVLFLSLAASKRGHYLLSLAPAAALLVLAAGPPGRWSRWRDRLLGVLTVLLALLFPAALLLLTARGWLTFSPALLAGWVLALAALALWWRPPVRGSLARWGLVLLTVLLGGAFSLLPALDAYRSPKAFYLEAAALATDGRPLVNWRNDRYSASFHLRRPVRPARTVEDLARLLPRGGWLLSQEQDLKDLPVPMDIVLRRMQRDPFQADHQRRWVLARVGPPASASPDRP